MENPIKMDDLGVPLFSETPTYKNTSIGFKWGNSAYPPEVQQFAPEKLQSYRPNIWVVFQPSFIRGYPPAN